MLFQSFKGNAIVLLVNVWVPGTHVTTNQHKLFTGVWWWGNKETVNAKR
jgi:hypothetical protein